MTLRVEQSSTSRIIVPLQPKVILVGWVNSTAVSEGMIMMWAD